MDLKTARQVKDVLSAAIRFAASHRRKLTSAELGGIIVKKNITDQATIEKIAGIVVVKKDTQKSRTAKKHNFVETAIEQANQTGRMPNEKEMNRIAVANGIINPAEAETAKATLRSVMKINEAFASARPSKSRGSR
jgi:maltose-binding protein MalE